MQRTIGFNVQFLLLCGGSMCEPGREAGQEETAPAAVESGLKIAEKNMIEFLSGHVHMWVTRPHMWQTTAEHGLHRVGW